MLRSVPKWLQSICAEDVRLLVMVSEGVSRVRFTCRGCGYQMEKVSVSILRGRCAHPEKWGSLCAEGAPGRCQSCPVQNSVVLGL